MQEGYEKEIKIDYQKLEDLKYYLEKFDGKITSANYNEFVKLKIEIPETVIEEFTNNYNTIGNNLQKIIKINKKYIQKTLKNKHL